MSKIRWVSLAMGCALLGGFASADSSTYTTSTGAVFTRVEHGDFGQAWRDPSGRIWSRTLGVMPNSYNFKATDEVVDSLVIKSPALKACTDIGGTLPQQKDFVELAAYFEKSTDTAQGKKDLFAIFPEFATYGPYWTKDAPIVTATFLGASSSLTYFDAPSGGVTERTTPAPVICITQ